MHRIGIGGRAIFFLIFLAFLSSKVSSARRRPVPVEHDLESGEDYSTETSSGSNNDKGITAGQLGLIMFIRPQRLHSQSQLMSKILSDIFYGASASDKSSNRYHARPYHEPTNAKQIGRQFGGHGRRRYSPPPQKRGRPAPMSTRKSSLRPGWSRPMGRSFNQPVMYNKPADAESLSSDSKENDYESSSSDSEESDSESSSSESEESDSESSSPEAEEIDVESSKSDENENESSTQTTLSSPDSG